MADQTQGRGGDSAPPDITTIIDTASPFPPIRRIGMFRPFTWLRLGWDDFRESGSASIFYGICFAAMGLILNLVLSHAPQYVSALSCGFLLIGPCWRWVCTTSAAV
jgi:uncharacterized membrane protein